MSLNKPSTGGAEVLCVGHSWGLHWGSKKKKKSSISKGLQRKLKTAKKSYSLCCFKSEALSKVFVKVKVMVIIERKCRTVFGVRVEWDCQRKRRVAKMALP